MQKISVSMVINGAPVTVETWPMARLLDVIRFAYRTKQKNSAPRSPAVTKKRERMREEQAGASASDEMLFGRQPAFTQANVCPQIVVERIERFRRTFSELLEQEFCVAAVENPLPSPGHRTGIVRQCPGPIENQVA